DQCAQGVCAADPVDCTVLDGPCQVGICDNGGCVAEEYACSLEGLQIQVPGGGFDAKAPGSFRIQGSVGQPAFTGPADSGGVYRIHYGFSPLIEP
ncbi:MAG: hypothetical protein VX938_04185, partial [Myxococcota bacterium]|nr:hypothetical protein [Myxococcota bacterium]